jgi:hypothetical protein
MLTTIRSTLFILLLVYLDFGFAPRKETRPKTCQVISRRVVSLVAKGKDLPG